ncbi:unnamed protein product [Parajaminaea phylloscopi]
MAIAPSPPSPHSAPGVTLSHRSRPNAKVVFLDAISVQNEDQTNLPDGQNFSSFAAQSRTISTPETRFALNTTSSATTTASSSRSSSNSIVTPASLSMDLAAAAVTPATTQPHSPSVKSDLSGVNQEMRRDMLSESDAATPRPESSAQIAPVTSKSTLPAWSQPRSWTGYASRTSGATSYFAPGTSDTDDGQGHAVPGVTGAGSGLSSSYLQSLADPLPSSQTTFSNTSSGSSTGWAKRQQVALEVLLAKAHTHFVAPLTEPRGLINTGNFCFGNAILQVLIFCGPFYNLFDTVGKELDADLTNTTPLMEAVVHFLREFRLTRTATSSEGRGQPPPLGTADMSDPFVPEYVYDAMRLNKRFDSMRRGHQEDAEEFLGFFLDTLHEELLAAIRKSNARHASSKGLISGMSSAERKLNGLTEAKSSEGQQDCEADAEREVRRPISPSEEGWMEVGQKGKTAFTRTTSTSDSPITKIFGGKLRSVLRTPGVKDSVTLEPYQPLQLDIQPSNVHTIEDALLNLTVPEIIPGVYSPARGGPVDATKQVMIEHLPPVLILHLKRFFYDEVGGVQKNSKEVGYGDVLEIGGDVVSPARRLEGKVTYRLFGVVYHHGRFATGGHYTVDVLRQDASSWVHFDDVLFNPVAKEHVGRKPGQNLSASVGHDGLAYLLFYQREDITRTDGDGPHGRQPQQGRAPPFTGKSTPVSHRQTSSSLSNGHVRSASASHNAAARARTDGSAVPGQRSTAAKSAKSQSNGTRSEGKHDAHTSPTVSASVPGSSVRQVPGAPPGKTRRVVSHAGES